MFFYVGPIRHSSLTLHSYIKELADKLTRLEESIAPRHLQYHQNSQPADLSYIHGLPDSALTQLQEFATSAATPLSRKRTFSVSDESHEQYGAPQRSTMSGWPSHETSRNVPYTPSGLSGFQADLIHKPDICIFRPISWSTSTIIAG